MVYVNIFTYARIVEQVVGKLHIAPTAKPNPWFSRDIYSPRDLQWGGYVGDLGIHKVAMVFGLNLEFLGAWKRVYPKVKENLPAFIEMLTKHKDLEWHWMSRPTQRSKDPPIKFLSPNMWTYQVDFEKWLIELEEILYPTKVRKLSPIRPQIQVMRLIGLPEDISNPALIKQNVEQAVLDLQLLVNFLGR
jgi:hypothetical protein